MRKGKIRTMMLKRVKIMHDYHDRIWKARQSGSLEPVMGFSDTAAMFAAADESRLNLIDQMAHVNE